MRLVLVYPTKHCLEHHQEYHECPWCARGLCSTQCTMKRFDEWIRWLQEDKRKYLEEIPPSEGILPSEHILEDCETLEEGPEMILLCTEEEKQSILSSLSPFWILPSYSLCNFLAQKSSLSFREVSPEVDHICFLCFRIWRYETVQHRREELCSQHGCICCQMERKTYGRVPLLLWLRRDTVWKRLPLEMVYAVLQLFHKDSN